MALDDDSLCVALLFCATFGVGSMSFGAVFAATGPVLASLAIYFLSACNLHSRCQSAAHLSFLTRNGLTIAMYSRKTAWR